MSLRAGSVIDARYELVERLGQGGQGSVWRALDRSTGEQRALKIIDLGDGDDEAAQRAHREARLVRGLKHPSLVDCHSVVDILQDRLLVLVFDLVSATPLSEARGDRRFGRVHWLAALRHIAAALAHLHRNGVVHRDLKPDNILVTPLFLEDPAAPGSLKIIDFGIAAPRRGPEGATLSGRFGTPAYMAPELFASPGLEEQRSPARDVFAFGVIAWELLEGSHPSGLPRGSSKSAYAASYQAFRSGRSSWPPRVPQGVWGSVISACLAIEPTSRPADGAAILALLGDSSQTPRLPEVSERRSRPSKDPGIEGPTDSHEAPRAERAPEPTVPSEPSKAVLATERAVVSSLPRAPSVDRTTPMLPGVVSEPASQGAPEPPKAPEEAASRGAGAAAQKRGRSWSWLLAVAAVVAVAPVVVLGMRSDPQRHSAATSVGAPALTLPPPTATVLDGSAPDASGTATSAPPPVRVCCGDRGECKSGRSCHPGDCKSDVPDDMALVIRPFLVEKQASPYGSKQNLGDPGQLPDSLVCIRPLGAPGNTEVCQPMTEIVANAEAGPKGPHASTLLRLRARDIRVTGIQLRIKNNGRPVWDRGLIASSKLLTSALCQSFTMFDGKRELFLTFYLDDP